jgi:hypothetical protein
MNSAMIYIPYPTLVNHLVLTKNQIPLNQLMEKLRLSDLSSINITFDHFVDIGKFEILILQVSESTVIQLCVNLCQHFNKTL